jgi:hypothetical protein
VEKTMAERIVADVPEPMTATAWMKN